MRHSRQIRMFDPRDRGGVAMLEFALLAPLVVIILLGTIELANAFRIQAKVNTATGVLAMLIAAQGSVTAPSGTLADLCTGAALNLAPFARNTLSADIVSITNDHPSARVSGSTDTTTITTYLDWENISSCPATSASTISLAGAYNVANSPASLLTKSGVSATGNSDLAYSNSAIVVKTSYQYTNVLSYLLGKSVTLTGTAVARPRANLNVHCTNVAGDVTCPALQ